MKFFYLLQLSRMVAGYFLLRLDLGEGMHTPKSAMTLNEEIVNKNGIAYNAVSYAEFLKG